MIKSCGDCGRDYEAPGYRSRYCTDCLRARKNERNRRWRDENPEKSKAASRKYAQADPERAKGNQRRYRQKLRSDPARLAHRLESRRISDRLRRERNGVRLRVISEEVYLQRYGNGSGWKGAIDATPVVDRIRLWLDDPDDVAHVGNGDVVGMHTTATLAAISGVNPRTIGRLLNGNPKISVRNADRLAVALDVPLSLVYPELP